MSTSGELCFRHAPEMTLEELSRTLRVLALAEARSYAQRTDRDKDKHPGCRHCKRDDHAEPRTAEEMRAINIPH
jgi:hypothetical protein